MTKPSLTITLSPDGLLQAILPDGRSLDLRHNPLQSIYTILIEQMNGNISMGQNGSPTRHQVWHWERHSIFPNSSCTFCRKEGKIKASRKEIKASIIPSLKLEDL